MVKDDGLWASGLGKERRGWSLIFIHALFFYAYSEKHFEMFK